MARKLGRSPLVWIERALFGPLGIKPGGWRRDRLGNPYFSAGAQVSARDLLAAGHLVRRKGWNWIFSRVPSSLMRTASTGSSANPMYGLGFWLNRLAPEKDAVECDVEEAISAQRPAWARSCLSKNAPSDLIAMVGSHGQRVYVSPSRDLIIVRLGHGSRISRSGLSSRILPLAAGQTGQFSTTVSGSILDGDGQDGRVLSGVACCGSMGLSSQKMPHSRHGLPRAICAASSRLLARMNQ